MDGKLKANIKPQKMKKISIVRFMGWQVIPIKRYADSIPEEHLEETDHCNNVVVKKGASIGPTTTIDFSTKSYLYLRNYNQNIGTYRKQMMACLK
jgi:hypothetical protein